MARRSDHSQEEIRDMALAASRNIIIHQGLAALSARKIAQEIGYTPGTLYLVFENQDDLILHINAVTLDQLYARLKAASSRCRKPQTCILKLGFEYAAFAIENRHLWNAIFEHRLPEGQHAPTWFQQHVTRLYELVEVELVKMADGKRIDSRLAATALWSGVHGICVLGLNDKIDNSNDKQIQQLVESLISNYLSGLLPND